MWRRKKGRGRRRPKKSIVVRPVRPDVSPDSLFISSLNICSSAMVILLPPLFTF